MSDPTDKGNETHATPEPEVLKPERNGPGRTGPRKEPPVIDGKVEPEAGSGRDDAPAMGGREQGGASLYGVAAIAGLVGALIVGGGLYGAGLIGHDGSHAAFEARLHAVETQETANADALTGLSGKLEAASQSADSAAALGARLEALEKATDDLKSGLADAQAAAAASSGRIDELAQSMPPADIADQIARLEALVKVLNTSVDTLAPRITALDGRVAALEAKKDDPDAAARATLGLALSNLARAATRAEPFARELDVVASFLPNEPALADLRPLGARGAPTVSELEARFPGTVRAVLNAERAASNDSLWQRFYSNARKLVTLRRTGEVAGEDTDAVLARMEERVKRGDLAAALVQAKDLRGAAAAAAKPWIDDAQARVTVDTQLAALTADVTKRLAQGAQD